MASSTDIDRSSFPLRSGQLLPRVGLTRAGDGGRTTLREGREPHVVAVVHSLACGPCREYLEELSSIAEEARGWDGRIVAVLGEGDAAGDAAMPLYQDPDGQLASLAPAVLVADRWGEIYAAAPAGDDHAWTSTDEILEWLRFIAIQCPECGVPEGGWRS